MINKHKKILKIGLILGLTLIMIMPIGAFAATHTVNDWDAYKSKVKEDIMKQEKVITINFGQSEIFNREYPAHLKIEKEFNEAIQALPKLFGGLNIKGVETSPLLNTPSKSVTHNIVYEVDNLEFKTLNGILNGEYKNIRKKVTDYEKIKAAYEYSIEALSDDEGKGVQAIKDILLKTNEEDKIYPNSHAFLFAVMMTELGYDNDIAVNTEAEPHKWNLVKVQGKWYHVDGKLETGDNGYFLISKKLDTDWDKNKHNDKLLENLAAEDYNGENFKGLQIKYEIELIIEEIIKISNETENISEEITMEEIKETKKELEIIQKNIISHEQKETVLKPEVDKVMDSTLKDEIQGLIEDLDVKKINASKAIQEKKEKIITKAVEKAEETLKIDDILIAKEAISMTEDNELKDKMDIFIIAVEAIEKAEMTRLNGDIGLAREAIEHSKISDLKLKLEERLALIKSIPSYVDDVENIIKGITDESLLPKLIKDVEDAIKIAESEVKKIKDSGIRTKEQNRIKEIKLVITAIKAVGKAEIEPFKMTNVTSASKAIDKINKSYWEEIEEDDGIINKLNHRLEDIEDKIVASNLEINAIKAVEKAEKSTKDADIELAKVAVELFGNSGINLEIKNQLDNRIAAIVAMDKLEKALIEYLAEGSKENRDKLGPIIGNADIAIKRLIEGNIRTQYELRLAVARNMRTAIDKIKLAEDSEEDKKSDAIKAAEEAIAQISDSKIKKQLEDKLKDTISKKEAEDKIKANEEAVAIATAAVNAAEESLTINNNNHALSNNIGLVTAADEKVKVLPNGNDKKTLQAMIKELNNVIKAKQMAEDAENKLVNGTLTLKDVAGVEKIVPNLDKRYREHKPVENGKSLEERAGNLRIELGIKEAAELLGKAVIAVDKAKETKQVKDITSAKKIVDLVKNEVQKEELITELENLEVTIAKEAVENAEGSAKYNNKTLSKDIAAAEKLVDAISFKNSYKDSKTNLNARIKALQNYLSAAKVLENAEKTRNEKDKIASEIALEDFQRIVRNVAEVDKDIYNEIIVDINKRIAAIRDYLNDENTKVTDAQGKVEAAEGLMTKTTEPGNVLILEAQAFVDRVTDKTIKVGLQKRIEAIQLAKDAKTAVVRAEAYPLEKSVKDAETALNKVDGRYADIIEDLGGRIADLRNKLDISKKVDEATNLVQKAIESRKETDISKAKFAIDGIEDLAPVSYESLNQILRDLKISIDSETEDETSALKEARNALYGETDVEDGEIGLFARIDFINTATVHIMPDEEDEAKHIQDVYVMIQDAKIQIIKANAAVRRLKEQKQLLSEIDYAKKELDASEDNLDVKEAVRLTTLASHSVNKVKDEKDKPKARLDIAAARRAIDKITHNDNKAIKTTILNTINAVESKLISDNDQEFIDIAIEAVNDAADILSKSVREDKVMEEQQQIDKAIFSAKMAIGWISENNKAAKDTLTSILNDIEVVYKSEKEGIANEERIKNAEEAVVNAEAKKESSELESYIRSARLRIRMIRNDGPIAELKINDLNTRLDILERKGGGDSDNKPGVDSNPDKTPTIQRPSDDIFTGVTQPKWGATKQLKKKSPIVELPKKKK